MARNDFENQIKDKLEKRMLNPSPDAWNKLSERLDTKNKKRSNKAYYRLFVAASIIAIGFISLPFLMTNKTINSTPKETDVSSEINIVKEISKETTIAAEEKHNFILETKELPYKIKDSLNHDPIGLKNQVNILASNSVQEVSDQENRVQETEVNENNVLTFEEKSIQNIVAQVQSLKDQNKKVTDADIETLLLQAQHDMILNRQKEPPINMVDADALLQDVEAELDQSFRQKVFEAIKLGYSKVKTTVAQRND